MFCSSHVLSETPNGTEQVQSKNESLASETNLTVAEGGWCCGQGFAVLQSVGTWLNGKAFGGSAALHPSLPGGGRKESDWFREAS
jgi:hypothetical protein